MKSCLMFQTAHGVLRQRLKCVRPCIKTTEKKTINFYRKSKSKSTVMFVIVIDRKKSFEKYRKIYACDGNSKQYASIST